MTRRTIWSCWFQGRDRAPELVRQCLQSWESQNPGWEVRVLDAQTACRYVDLRAHIDLRRQTLMAASLSDILRILLLHEYGGVWVDATTFCNVPLDDWLPNAVSTGFFAFPRPDEDRPLTTWFLAAEAGNPLIAKWAARTVRYWRGRERATEDFWLHYQFGLLCSIDREALRAWERVPRISCTGRFIEHAYEDFEASRSSVDWTSPVIKLTHQLDPARLTASSLVGRLLGLSGREPPRAPAAAAGPRPAASSVCLPGVRAGDLGDHILKLAGEHLLRRAGLSSSQRSRDLLLHGEFRGSAPDWPPHPRCRALYIGFRIAPSQASSLTPAALEHYAAHGPVGCRDRQTLSLLRSLGVDAFLSHCLTLTFPRRLPDRDCQTELFVVSGDRRILDYLPESLAPFTFISHDSDSGDSSADERRAAELLRAYRDRARLVVTTLLDCALPVIAMGIPVVVFYPPENGSIECPDLTQFSSLVELVRVFRLEEAACVDWAGYAPDVSDLKLKLIDRFFAMTGRWGDLPSDPLGPIAPTSEPVTGPGTRFS